MRVGYDLRPALFSRSGIGRHAGELARAFGALEQNDDSPLELILYGDALRDVVEPDRVERIVAESGGRLVRRRIPGRLMRALARFGIGVERRTGPIDLFHHTDIVYPPVVTTQTVVTLHDLVFEQHPEFHGADFHADVPRRVRAAVASAKAVIASSQATSEQVIAHYHVDPSRLFVVPLAADHVERVGVAPHDEVARFLGERRITRPYVLFVATIEPRKNHARLLDAFTRFAKDRPHHLVIVGSRGWLCDDVMQRLAESGPTVHHLEGLSDRLVAALYRGAEFSVYPSLYEGFGLPVLESMALGIPVVTTRRGAIEEVGGDAVLYCDPDDVASIAAAMGTLADDASLREDFARRGIARARLFSWKETARRHVEIYRTIVHGA